MIVVIGAGLIGLGIAYELAKRGADVRVVDANAPGRAASWAGAGMLAPYSEAAVDAGFAAFCVRSLALYPAYVEELRACSSVDARLRLDGTLEVAFEAAGAERLQRHLAELSGRGVAARWVSSADVRRLEPSLGNCAGGVAVEGEGQVDNRRLGRALEAACLALHVPIDTGAGAVALEADARRVLGVRTPEGFRPANAVVNASGAWAGELAGVPEAARIPVRPIKGQMLALAAPRGFIGRVLWVPGAYLVPRDDGRLLVGATVEDAGFDVRVTARGQHALLGAALAALPSLGERTVSETWAGLRPGSPDGKPFIGATGLSGYFVAAGHYRNGILLTPATALAVADALEGKPLATDVAGLSPGRLLQEALAVAANPT